MKIQFEVVFNGTQSPCVGDVDTRLIPTMGSQRHRYRPGEVKRSD